MELVEVHVNPCTYRFNDSNAALGRIKRVKLCGITYFWSPDALVYFVPTLFTLFLVFGVLYTLWKELGYYELCVLYIFLFIAFFSSFLITCTDPGIYPRLRHGEIDPLLNLEGFVFCRICALRRPLRTSHCYVCNVCVREHDHHCGIIGGCIGQRNLRWFTLYLITITNSAIMGLFWICRSLFEGTFSISTNQNIQKNSNIVIRNISNMSNIYTYTQGKKGIITTRNDVNDVNGVESVILILLFIPLLLVVLLVGSFCLFYIYLVLTSITRRESGKIHSNLDILLHPKIMYKNIKHVMFPPPSMLFAPVGGNISIV